MIEICNIFGLSGTWWYLDELLGYVIVNNRCDELLRYLFDRDKFRVFLKLRALENINN